MSFRIVFLRFILPIVLIVQNLWYAYMGAVAWHSRTWAVNVACALFVGFTWFAPRRTTKWVSSQFLILWSTLRHPQRTRSRMKAGVNVVTGAPHRSPVVFRPPPSEAVNRPVIGYRVWEARRGKLKALVDGARWKPGGNRAFCSQFPFMPWHRVPRVDCSCGFYAHHRPLSLFFMVGGQEEIQGIILGYGRIVRHGLEGFRAERARVIALLTPSNERLTVEWERDDGETITLGVTPAQLVSSRYERVLENLAARYRVPIIAFDQAEEFAARHGASIAPVDPALEGLR